MKKMLAILGSPRKGGNCARLLDAAIEQARAKGYAVDFIDLYEKSVAPCKGCMACKKTRRCVLDDDAEQIRQLLVECDLVAIVSPTYFANVSAPVKNLFDRLVGAVMDDNLSFIPRPLLKKSQRYLLMTACTTPFPFDRLAGQSRGTIKAMREFFHISGMKQAGTVILAGTKNKDVSLKKATTKIKRLIRE